MKDLLIERAGDTLGVACSVATGVVELTGESYPEDAFTFFESISGWISSYLGTFPERLSLVCTITYLNSSSSKCLFDLFDMVARIKPDGCAVTVVWRFEEGDEDNREIGIEFSEDVDLPFNVESYT